MAESKETFEFSVEETLKDLSESGKHIELNRSKKLPLESSPWTGRP